MTEAKLRGQLFVRAHLVLGAFAVAQHGLRGFLVAPEIRVGGSQFEGFYAFAMLRGVKDNSAQA